MVASYKLFITRFSGAPKAAVEPNPNDAPPSFVQVTPGRPATSLSQTLNGKVATPDIPVVNGSNQIYRPITTAPPTAPHPKPIIQPITTQQPADEVMLKFNQTIPVQQATFPNLLPADESGQFPLVPHVDVIHSPLPPPPDVSHQLPQFPNLNPSSLAPLSVEQPPIAQPPVVLPSGNNPPLNVPHFPPNKTPFPHFPSMLSNGVLPGNGVLPPNGVLPASGVIPASGVVPASGVGPVNQHLPENFPFPGNTDFFWTTPIVQTQTTETTGPQPYTIPFLTRGPIVGPAFAIGPAFTLPNNFQPKTPVPVPGDSETLPPSIILATIPSWTTPPKDQQFLDTVRPYPEFFTQTVKYIDTNAKGYRPTFEPGQSINRTFTDLPPQVKTVPPKKSDDFGAGGNQDAAVGGDFNNGGDLGSPSKGSATTTIAVCLTVVVVVMVAVFITLCVVRHKSNSKKSVSSASRTSAYVAAQAARMNYAASGYGTGAYIREAPPRPPRSVKGGASSGTIQPQNTQTWIYAPGTYASASQYYK